MGIDVGGTFTDVVAIDAATRMLVARVKVPTTHHASDGVAAGIVAGITTLLEQCSIAPHDVAFIAHSTTQATNALLEGDVARVGVLGVLDGFGALAAARMRFAPVPLTASKRLEPPFVFARADDTELNAAIGELARRGVESVAVTSAFGVDDGTLESTVARSIRERGIAATCGHDVSSLYGLRARTRTAALNAAILPIMMRTAHMTDAAVKGAAIAAPLLIMRSDGGVMDVAEVERRPIQTMLSGPAAGIAGALFHENVTDGIFVEVGGTSADLSVIRAGQPQMRAARIGGHRTMLQTLDVRTLAIAGGSMVRVGPGGIADVGPRSAHIAGARYACFVEPGSFDGAHVERVAPTQRDSADYAVIVTRDGTRIAVTPTCAANLLGDIPDGNFARGDDESARRGFEVLGAYLGLDARACARRVLDMACAKVTACVEELIAQYALERESVVLVGGGGGAAALVPGSARHAGLASRLARDAEVISPIGVALALVRDVVERTIVDPTPGDILRVRREASDRAVAAGAAPDRVDVTIEIDAQRNRVRAIASGATAMVEGAAQAVRGAEERRAAAALSMRTGSEGVSLIAASDALDVYEASLTRRGAFGRTARVREQRIVDERAIVRFGARDALVVQTTAAALAAALRRTLEEATVFSDVGRALPELYILHGARIADFRGIMNTEHAIALAVEDIAGREPTARVVIVAKPRK